MIHRGPSNKFLTSDRISLYITFPLKNQISKITTDFAYPNWAWIDSHFSNSTINKRSSKQIDFIILNNLLHLYPFDWHGENVNKYVENQIIQRKLFISEFPQNSNLYYIQWNNKNDFYLATCFLEKKNQIKILYHPTIKTPKITFETIYCKSIWENINKIHIQLNNIHLYQGYSWISFESYIRINQNKKKIIIYPFSHLCSIESEIVIPFEVSCEIYVHKNLYYI